MSQTKIKIAIECLVFCLGTACFYLLSAHDADSVFPIHRVFLVFLAFSAWSLGVLALGNIFGNLAFRIKPSFFLAILFGSIFAVVFATIVGHLGLLQYRPLFSLCLIAGLIINYYQFKEPICSLPKLNQWSVMEKTLFFVICAAIFFRFLQCLVPLQHGDPLYYHIAAPRQWVQHGKIVFIENLPILFTASYWEYLYIWPQALWYTGKSFGLIEAQLMSQWIHLFWGWGGSAIAIYYLVLLFTRNIKLALFACLTGISVASLQWTADLAKNDWGVIFWLISAACLLYREPIYQSAVSLCLSGILLGMGLMGKFTNAFFVIFVLDSCSLFLLLRSSFHFVLRAFSYICFGIFIATAPILFRNFYATGNPFFPTLNDIYPSHWITESYQDYLAPFQIHEINANWAYWQQRFIELLKQGPLLWLVLLCFLTLPIFWRYLKNEKNPLLPSLGFLLYIGLAPFFLFVLLVGNVAEMRLLGAPLAILGALSAVLLIRLREVFLPKKNRLDWLVLVLLVATSHMPTHMLIKVWRQKTPDQIILQHRAGEAKAWLRKNAGENDLIVMIGENESYYLSSLNVTVLTERPDLDTILQDEKDPAMFLKKLKEKNVRFLLDAIPELGVSAKITPLLIKRNAITFQAQGARIIDLEKI